MRWGAVVLLVSSLSATAVADELPLQPVTHTTTGYEVEYRWPRWVPWTVLGGFTAVGALGGLVWLDAQDKMNEYDQRVASTCAVNGCNLSDPQTPAEQALADELNEMRDTAESRNTIGTLTILVAGAGVITGVVLVVLNRPKLKAVQVDVTPTPGGAAASASFRF